MTWLELAAQTDVVDVAIRFGRDVRRAPSANHCACPACGAERRHPSRGDRRGAVGIAHRRPLGWRCFVCSASGDAIDFAAYVIGGARFRELDQRRKREVREWFERALGVGSFVVEYRRPPVAAPVAPTYPPADGMRMLWAAGLPVHKDQGCADYLTFRGIDPRVVWSQDLAFALPWASLPDWTVIGERNWARSLHRLIVPLYDADGVLRSCIARSIERQPQIKSVAPRGYSRAGLVMANRVALAMLRRKARPTTIVVREGEIDHLAEASTAAEHVAVLGIVSGSWSAAIADRVPAGAHVVVATDADEAGDRYAETIAATLRGRVRLERRREAA